jgi:DNA-binding XRE family transcriptional regulator
MEIAEIAELEDVRDDLAALSVAEVVIQPIVDETMNPPTGWQAVVILSTPDARLFTPWVLAVRASEGQARSAVVTLLRGIVDARRATQMSAPAVEGWNNVVSTQRALRAVDDWKQRRDDRAAPADPTPADATPTAFRTPPEVFPLSAPAPCYRETAYEGWRLEVRTRREERRLTQVQLASEVGMSPSNLSRIERGLRKPSVVLANALSSALGLEPPGLADVPAGNDRIDGEPADAGSGVLLHSGSNGAAATRD